MPSWKAFLPSLPGQGGAPESRAEEKGLASSRGFISKAAGTADALKIPPKPWHTSPGATLSESLSSLLRPGFGYWARGLRRWQLGSCVWVCGGNKLWQSHRHSPGPDAVPSHSWAQSVCSTTLRSRYYSPPSTGKRMEQAQVRKVARDLPAKKRPIGFQAG